MTGDLNIREIKINSDPALKDVEHMFGMLYEEESQGIELAEQGAQIWLRGVMKGAGRFGVLLLASLEGQNIGFAHGNLRILPDYYGNLKVGFISHVYVKEKYRGKGFAVKLVKGLEEWFAAKEVHSVELDVLTNNQAGTAFWKKMGYSVELYRSRKMGSEL